MCVCVSQGGVWETLLAALEVLIRVHHPLQVFNIRQLLNAQVVQRFLLTCQVLQVGEQLHSAPTGTGRELPVTRLLPLW